MGVGKREKEEKETSVGEQPGRTGPTHVDRVSLNRCLKARHESDSFEPAKWSERLSSRRSGWLGAAAAGSIPAFSTFFSLLFFCFSPFLAKIIPYSPARHNFGFWSGDLVFLVSRLSCSWELSWKKSFSKSNGKLLFLPLIFRFFLFFLCQPCFKLPIFR